MVISQKGGSGGETGITGGSTAGSDLDGRRLRNGRLQRQSAEAHQSASLRDAGLVRAGVPDRG